MASTDPDLRHEVVEEREKLVEAVATLRSEFRQATDIRGKLRAHRPAVLAGALAVGFVAAGGIGATARLLTRR